MLDFTEQEASTTLQPELSPDTPIVSDNLQGISDAMEAMAAAPRLADPEITAATIAKLAPYLTKEQFKSFVQTEEETEEV